MANKTTTGLKLHVVKGEPATDNQAGYEALTYVEVGKVLTAPDYGGTAAGIPVPVLADGVVDQEKGSITYAETSIGLAYDISDAGQLILSEGFDGTGQYDVHSFKVEYSNGDADYFVSNVYAFTISPGGQDSLVGSSVDVKVKRKPVFTTV